MSRKPDVLTAPLTMDGWGHPLTYEQEGDEEALEALLTPELLDYWLGVGKGRPVARCPQCSMFGDRKGSHYQCRACATFWWDLT